VTATRTGCETSPASGREAGRGAPLVFFGTAALLFTAAAVATALSCAAMETMGAVPMAGGWLLSGIWLPLCGQSWFETAACFLGMWLVMMVAMMLPSLTPALWRYREAAFAAGAHRPGGLATLAGASYFVVWTGFGLLTFLLGASLAGAALPFPALARLGPLAAALVILIAGLVQASRWKARLLADCHGGLHASRIHPDAKAAVGDGAVLGLRCCLSCIGPMAALTAGGLMDLRLMAGVTIAITAERLLPVATRIADAIGVAMAAVGLLLLVQVAG
jgi:predicted metal-binding membrane protein